MAFEIRPVDRQTFDAIWTPKVKEQLDELIYSTDHWIDDLERAIWVIDNSRQTTVMRVGMANKFDAAECYALVQLGEFALIRNVGWGTYSIAAFSQGFRQRLDEVRDLAAEALLIGGQWLDGNPELEAADPLRSIPYVKFVEYVAPKIGE